MKRIVVAFLVVLCYQCSYAQIPNSSFESWDSSAGYFVPVGWDTRNPLTQTTGVYTCERDTPGVSGAYFLKLTAKPVPGMGIVSGVAFCGPLDPVTQMPTGFPFASRPQVLSGKWQFMGYGNDNGFISIMMTKWNTATNSRDIVANTFYPLPFMIMHWEQFQVGINYLSNAVPDSAMIELSTSSATLAPPEDKSFLWVDDLEFSDSIPNLNVTDLSEHTRGFSLFPNPANEQVTVSYYSLAGSDVTIYLGDISGKVIRTVTTKPQKGNNSIPVNTAGISSGLYFIRLVDESGTIERKLVIE